MVYRAKFDSSVSDITKLAPLRILTVGEVHHLFVPVYDALHAENFVKICPNVMEQSSSQLFTITRTQTDRQTDRQTDSIAVSLHCRASYAMPWPQAVNQ